MHVTFYRHFDRLLGHELLMSFFEESVQLLQPFTENIVTSANFLTHPFTAKNGTI